MTTDQYTELIDFLAGKFGGIDGRFEALERRFDGLEARVVRVEAGVEALRQDVQILAEGLASTNERLDRYHRDHEVRIRALEDRWLGH
jgi:chromosome segregation ATPase